jgi:hypothetical protein
MDPEKAARIRAAAAAAWQRVRARSARIPLRARVVLGLFLVAASLLGLHTALAPAKDSALHLKVQHSFRSAQISVWVDGELAYSGKLAGYMRKKFGLLPDSVQGSLSQTVPVPSGNHLVRVQVYTDDGSVQEETITGEFAAHSERNLSVSARRGDVALAWQGGNSVPAEASVSGGWIARYATTLFLTIAGSIISALTGFAVREVPGYLRSRQDPPPKAESATAGR